MPDVRILTVAGGGGGGTNGGGGGAGGFLDETTTIDIATSYDVVVGSGGTAGVGTATGTNGGDSYIKKTTDSLTSAITDVFNMSFNTTSSKSINVSSINTEPVVWLEMTISGTDERNNDGVLNLTLGGTSIYTGTTLFNGTYLIDVTSIVSGQSSVTLEGFSNDTAATITSVFKTGYLQRSVGGGAGAGGGSTGSPGIANPGGSGGGGAGSGATSGDGSTVGKPGVPGQGNDGAAGDEGSSSGPGQDDGGGGGASADGTNPNGGNGATSDITGSTVTYAGGGAGQNDGSGGTGGSGGGGSQGVAGTDGLGGGGGQNADGGNGIVILRYDPTDFWHSWTGGTITDGYTETTLSQNYAVTGGSTTNNYTLNTTTIANAESVVLTTSATGDFNGSNEQIWFSINGTNIRANWIGSEYVVDVTSIIGANNSVDVEIYTETSSSGGTLYLDFVAQFNDGTKVHTFTSDGTLEPVLSANGFFSMI